MDEEIISLASILGKRLFGSGLTVVTAESCTGGSIASAITEIAGSSSWFEQGFVTYSNTAKTQLLSVTSNLLNTHGAVSEAVVEAMVTGALAVSKADLAIAVSGIAGPDGGSIEKPVGTVWIAVGDAECTVTECTRFTGDRVSVRQAATKRALQLAIRHGGDTSTV